MTGSEAGGSGRPRTSGPRGGEAGSSGSRAGAPPVIRLGVVGLGVISRFYLAAIASSPRFELAAVCDVDERALAGHHVPAYRSHREMLDAGGLDAVVVTAPHDVHAAVTADAIGCGLPVCVEKPLATTLRDGLAVAEAARARDVALFTAFHRRYNANVLALRDKLAGAAPIEQLTVRYLERIEEHVADDRWYLDPARSGGGCVADNGPNALDLARLFLDELTLESALVTRVAGVDRQAVLHVRGSAPAVVELGWSHAGETKDVTARLADGTVLRADVLEGYDEFEGSLWHEYEAVLRDFASAVAARSAWRDGGLAALDLVDEVYRREGA
ncbi:Gfo/Idh/MocA family protein [Saccharothrix luteola]|uniref:Gfo/Idh/MocA family protein n=1 Tax=Saccharothrix luteola TaxID=2893018 RepID=UPI001E63BCDD|nr:Gfo/Idh/MocA family oxidoreductase [Saccharothrix luteola]MCC8246512.1 Gfo/Idh/MocA family oxidoreductase [Saccharothrix luteola]